MCALLMSQFTNPMLAESDQHSTTSTQSSADQGKVTDSKPPAKPQKELPPAQSSAQESKPAQPKTQTSKSEESKAKKDNGEEGTEKEKEAYRQESSDLADSDGQTCFDGRPPLVSV